MIQMVNYYQIPSGRNAGIAVVFGKWPERVMKHRGWTSDRHITMRVATQAEHDWLATCLRHQAFLYPDVERLLDDESQILNSVSLATIANSFKL